MPGIGEAPEGVGQAEQAANNNEDNNKDNNEDNDCEKCMNGIASGWIGFSLFIISIVILVRP